jgi:hypothetical protein
MPDGVADERGFNLLRRMREETGRGITLTAFKQLLREQFLMLVLDERRAAVLVNASYRGSYADLKEERNGQISRLRNTQA